MVEWEAVIESTARMTVLLIECLEHRAALAGLHRGAASLVMSDQCLQHPNAEG